MLSWQRSPACPNITGKSSSGIIAKARHSRRSPIGWRRRPKQHASSGSGRWFAFAMHWGHPMIPDEITPIDESWITPLLDAEEALLGDRLGGTIGATNLPRALDGVPECLHLLEQLWPRAEFSTPTDAQAPP